jgi:hypothetical protein
MIEDLHPPRPGIPAQFAPPSGGDAEGVKELHSSSITDCRISPVLPCRRRRTRRC